VGLALLAAPRGGSVGRAAGPPAQVLVVYADSPDIPAFALAERGLRASFAAAPGGRPDAYTEILEDFRFPDPGFQREQADWLRRKYAGRRLDVVVAIGAPSAPPGRAAPFPYVPAVLAGAALALLAAR
jgi:hypothetical protein